MLNEIEELTNQFITHIMPERIYLFGSHALGTSNENSDLDFYIVVKDDISSDIVSLTTQAYRSIRQVKKHPVDIIVGTASRFEYRKNIPSIESEVYQKGLLLYGTRNEKMD